MKKTKKGTKLVNKRNKEVRLNKFIADAGICSRRKADDLIAAGVVRVNKKKVTELGTKVNPSDFVTVKGDPIGYREKLTYILLNKPKDTISTTDDEKDRRTVMDVVRSRNRVFPVGRLDRNTTGALLITNDGELANRLMHPSYKVEKTYLARLEKPLLFEHAEQIAQGVELEDGKTAPCKVIIEPGDNTRVWVTLIEGKNREIHRMFEKFDYRLKSLDRKAYATLTTEGMKRGDYRHLKKKEVANLKKMVGLE